MAEKEEALKPIRELLEHVRERIDYAIGRLKSFDDVRALSWKCAGCGYVKKFTRPVPAEVASSCPKCSGTNFERY